MSQDDRRRNASSRLSRVSVMLTTVCLVLSAQTATARVWVVNQSHVSRSDDHGGTPEMPFATISRAAALAEPGDSVLVHEGTYRERVAPARGGQAGRPIVYSAAPGEHVVIKGSELWQPRWQRPVAGQPIYAARLDPTLFAGLRVNPYRTLLKQAPGGKTLTLGQLFVNSVPVTEVDDAKELLDRPNTWRVVDGGQEIWIHLPPGIDSPTDGIIELTTRERIFAPLQRGLGYIHVIGFTMEHCANQFPDKFWSSDTPQAGALGCRAGHHWQIQGNTIRFAKAIGIDCGYEGRRDLEGTQPTPRNTGYHLIRDNLVTDNGCCGIAGMRSQGTVITGNIVERNNRLHHIAPEIGGIKLHYFNDGRIEGNVIRDNDAHGIWLDNTYRNARVRRNLVIGNRGCGIFVELGQGPLIVDHNVVGLTRPGFHPRDARGDGLYTHDASGITFAHNLVFGSHRFGSFHTKATARPGAGVSHVQLLNNIFINNQEGHIHLPYTAPDAQGNLSDHNLFGPNPGGYLVHPWGGLSPEVLRESIERRLGSRPLLWNDASSRLKLPDWRIVTGWDRQSVEATQAEVRLSDDWTLQIELPTSTGHVAAVPVKDVDRDYFNQAIVAEHAAVGPFQHFKPRTSYVLWP